MFFKRWRRKRTMQKAEAVAEKNADRMGDGVPRTYSGETKSGKERTSFGGSQGGD